MQERKKRRIVIASVLKPADEPRMFHKIGLSLSKLHEVHVFGAGDQKITHNELSIHAHKIPSRLSLRRLLLPWMLFNGIKKVKPDILIVCTHELLIVGVILKLLSKTQLVYDVQENYASNIRFTDAFPSLLRPVLATWVRLKEKVTAPFVDYFILAEEVYETEMPFMSKRSVVIQNKFKPPGGNVVKTNRANPGLTLVFSGTLAESTGVFLAMELAKQLHACEPSVSLHIIGYAADHRVQMKIREVASQHRFIKLTGIEAPVPYDNILEALRASRFGVIAYPDNAATRNRIPTKLYEYIGLHLPMLLVNNPRWMAFTAELPTVICFDPARINPALLLEQMRNCPSYPVAIPSVFWHEDEQRLLNLFK